MFPGMFPGNPRYGKKSVTIKPPNLNRHLTEDVIPLECLRLYQSGTTRSAGNIIVYYSIVAVYLNRAIPQLAQ